MPRAIKPDLYDGKKAKPKDLLWQKRVYKKDDMREFFKICRMLDKACAPKSRAGYGRGGRAGGGRREISALQNCVVKCRIGKEKDAHLRFLAEYMPQKNKSQVEEKPALFSGEIVDAAFIEKYKERMADKHFKFIISPENQNVDAQALVKTLVKRMEAATGCRFSWLAAVHTDTAHKHAHLLVNGVDKNGRDIVFDKMFIKQTMREMSRQICTEMVGKRSGAEMQAERDRLYKSSRYCRLDDELRLYEKMLEQPEEGYRSTITVAGNVVLQNRLNRLVELGLAAQREDSRHTYLLEKDWAEKLQTMGRYNSFLKARSEAQWTDAARIELYTAQSGAIWGNVTKLYRMNDEDSWNHALLVESKEAGKAWYVPLYYEPEAGLLGKDIRCEMRENQRGQLTPRIRAEKDFRQASSRTLPDSYRT